MITVLCSYAVPAINTAYFYQLPIAKYIVTTFVPLLVVCSHSRNDLSFVLSYSFSEAVF